MKFQIIIAALATLLSPIYGAQMQCAGGVPDNRGEGSGVIYENSGFLTADFTQKVCAASGGSIIPNTTGNQKCCKLPDARVEAFSSACASQKAGSNYATFGPFFKIC